MEQRLQDPEYKNWLRCTQGLQLVKEGVKAFIEDTSKKQHREILDRLGAHGTCSSPCTEKTPCQVCGKWIEEIIKCKKSQLIWKNAKSGEWPTNHWEVAKVYMGQGQHKPGKNGPDDMDTSALLQLISNNKFYMNILNAGSKNTKYEKHIKDVIEIRNKLMHSPNQAVTDSVTKSNIEAFKVIPNITAINEYQTAKKSLAELEKLVDCDFNISEDEEKKALKEKMDAITRLVMSDGGDVSQLAVASPSLQPAEVGAVLQQFEAFLDKHDDLKLTFSSEMQDLKQEVQSLHGPMAEILQRVTELGHGAAVSGFDPSAEYIKELNHKTQKSRLTYKMDDEPYEGGWIGIVVLSGREFRSSKGYPDKKTARKEAAFRALTYLKSADESSNAQTAESKTSATGDDKNQSSHKRVSSPTSALTNKLAERLEHLHFPSARYDTKQDGEGYTSRVKVKVPYLWTAQDASRGKKPAEEEVAKLLAIALNLPAAKSAKVSVKDHCDKTKLSHPKYYAYSAPSNIQDFYGVAWFNGKENGDETVFHGPRAEGEGQSVDNAAELVISVLDHLGVEALETSEGVREAPSDGVAVSPTGINNEPDGLAQEGMNYKSRLNELIQRARLDEPEYKSETSSDGKAFKCKISWPKPWKVEVVSNPPEYTSSKKEAEKKAAQLALKNHFGVEESIENSKNKLSEIFQKRKMKDTPKYDTVEKDKKFLSTVSFELEKVFETSEWFDSKKKAKENAARLAYEDIANQH